MSGEDVSTRLDSLEEKLAQILELVKNGAPKKKVSSSKKSQIEQFKLSTKELLETDEPLCAYMQKGKDCKGHCGREAMYTVQSESPIELSSINPAKPKDENRRQLRKAYLRCKTCKNKGKTKTQSRGYDVIRSYLYKGDSDGEGVAEDNLEELTSTPKKEKKLKGSKKKEKNEKEDSDDSEPDVEKGLDDPSEPNSHLKKTEDWRDKFVKLDEDNNVIIRAFKDKRKKEVVIGKIDEEPENDEYEDVLTKPKKSLLDKYKLKYKSPEDSIADTPPKAKKNQPKVKVSKKDDSDDSDNDFSAGDDSD